MLIIGIPVLLGGLVGGAIDDAHGAFIGALVGYAIGHLIRGNSKHAALETRITSLETMLSQLRDTMAADWAERQSETTQTSTATVTGAMTRDPLVLSSDPAPFDASPRSPDIATSAEAYIPGDPFQRRGVPAKRQMSEDDRPIQRDLAAQSTATPNFEPFEKLRAFLFGGNTVVRVGIIILLFGVGFLVKYAADNAYLPIELRLLGAVLLGVALLVIGFRVRTQRLAYAVSLQGGGIGIIYVVTFAALKIYTLIPASAAFAIFVVLGVATAVLSIVQDAIALAVLGIIGGFLAPILASTGSGDHVGLFTYYAILNAGILAIAWFKAWRVLNSVGFAFTFIIGTAWGVTSYKPEHFESAQLFLALFFVFYAAIAVIYALRRPTAQRGFIDTTLVFGLPAITFALEVGLVVHTDWGLAVASVIIAAFYVLVATIVYKADKEHGRALAEAFTAIGLTFVTMAVPFALNASWTAAAYALEGAGLVWVGRRQNRPLAEVAGVFLQFAAGFTFDSTGAAEATQPVLGIFYPYAFLRAAGAIASAYFLRTRVSTISRVFQGVLVVWALGWATGGAVYDIDDHNLERYGVALVAGAIASHA
ncbi:MAG: DUF2339 domain-containing protein, partial [Clostridia bacterium]|nr:DUF2339 domain-containing protein [Deltaproteobacteria bacterium]